MSVAFVIPLYNEEDVLPLLVEALETYRGAHPEITRVIFVNDGSRDRTGPLVQQLTAGKPGYTLLSLSRNFGHQLAITAGLSLVEEDAAVILDADLQDPLNVVTEMIARWKEGYDVVYGIRRTRDGETWVKKTATRIFYRFFRWFTDFDMPLDTGDFRLVSRSVLDAYNRIQEQQPFVRGLIAWLGFNQIGIVYDRPARAAGRTKYPYRRLWHLATTGLTSFSDKPLRLAVRLGLFTALLSFGGLIWVLLQKLVFGVGVIGWASIVFVGFFFGGVQLFFLGIVGTYLSRVYEEVKARPRFIVQHEWHSAPPTP